VASKAHQTCPAGRSIEDPDLYFNRELSWLDFNLRVLELAEDPAVPLAERLRFCAIYTSNLDEFFMVRVAGLHDQLDAGVNSPGPDGLTPAQTIAAIREKVLAAGRRLATCFEEQLRPLLAERGVEIASVQDLDSRQRGKLRARFQRAIFPALTPLAVAPGRPFPYISNLSLSLAVLVRDPAVDQTVFARVKVPIENLPRFISFESRNGVKLLPLEEVIAHHLEELFPGMEIVANSYFRVTRDADLEVSDDAADLLQAVEAELRRRRFGEVVRVEVAEGCTAQLLGELVTLLGVEERDLYPTPSLLDMRGLEQIARLPALAKLRFKPFAGITQPRLLRHEGEAPDVFAAMREGDILVHHPYDSFATSVERFVEQAVADPDVLAIKQTLYRTSDDSRLVPALIEATERGKQAVALVELQARFDERRNIQWARALEQAGVHVVYGQPQLKTHVKCVLVVRREGDGVRNYVHIGTGNYNSVTARIYTDLGLFTTDPEIGADIADMFNYLTGFGRQKRYRRILTAPEHLREGVLAEIARTVAAAKDGEPARIALKINALVDQTCIKALYEASRAGVKVDLNVRGICCLRPGVEGVSERIRVVSIVGRFLEHARIFLFQRGNQRTVYISSADLMPRNLDHRVEAAVPIVEPALQEQLVDVLERAFADNTNSWELGADGRWRRRSPQPGEAPRNLQEELIELHRQLAAKGPLGGLPSPSPRPRELERTGVDGGVGLRPRKPL
jgi:polyphosphate kinase